MSDTWEPPILTREEARAVAFNRRCPHAHTEPYGTAGSEFVAMSVSLCLDCGTLIGKVL